MASNSTDLRQQLLTRSDLAAMAVADERVDAWLAGGELALVDMVEEETGSTAVYAATTDSLRDQLLLLLEQHGRNGVLLSRESVRNAMQLATEEALAAAGEDVIAEHSAEEQLDQAIDAITDVIDDLVEANEKFPTDLKSEEAVALVDELAVEEPEPAAAPAAANEPAAPTVAAAEAVPTPVPTKPSAAPVVEQTAVESRPLASEPAPATPAPVATTVVQPVVHVDLQPVVEALQQVHLAVLALGERQQPQFDTTPITAALDHGIRALQQDVAKAADRTALREGVELLRSTIAAAGESIVTAVAATATQPPTAAAGTAPVREQDARPRGLDLAAVIATVAIATGWGIAIWTFAGDMKLALGAVVCANLVGCCALLLRRR